MFRKAVITIAFWFAVLFSLVLLPARFQSAEGQGEKVSVPIVRNAAWNDLQRRSEQCRINLEVVHNFLVRHENEVRVSEYDIPTFKAIDEATANLKVAEKDLQTIRNELSWRENSRQKGE